jgi:hypothetical protein
MLPDGAGWFRMRVASSFGVVRRAAGWDEYVNFAKAAMPDRSGVAVIEGGT